MLSRPAPVLLFIHSLGHGGSERQLAGLARSLDRRRFLPHVASVLGGFHVDQLRSEGVPVIEFPLRSYLRRDTLAVARSLRRYIRKQGITLVHSFDYGPAFFGVAVARSAGVIALSSQRFYMDSVPPKYRRLVLAAHWLAHGVVANSEALRQYLHERYWYPLRRIDVCPNGLDTAIFHPRDRRRFDTLGDADLVIGSVCVLRKEKNLGQLLRAFAQVRGAVPNSKLLLVGSGPEEPGLRLLATQLGIDDSCCFLPTTQDVPSALRSIDIFVHPSLSEGMPNAVMEAMACGCMVIASRAGGGPELIQHGIHGFLTNTGDQEDLVRNLTSAIRDPAGCRRMAAAAAERIQNGFSIAASARRLEQIYSSYILGPRD